MNPNSTELSIKIGEIAWYKSGRLVFDGYVDHDIYVHGEMDASIKGFEELLPKEPAEFTYVDHEGFCNAAMDSFFNLHWLLLIGGNIIYRVVYLEPIIKNWLLETYLRNPNYKK